MSQVETADSGAHLGTPRMTLRRFTSDDVDLLVDLDSDPEVMRFLTGRATERDEIRELWMPRILAAYRRNPGFGRWAAQLRESGEFLGWFGLRIDDAPTLPKSSSDTGCVGRPGVRAWRPRAAALWSATRSPSRR